MSKKTEFWLVFVIFVFAISLIDFRLTNHAIAREIAHLLTQGLDGFLIILLTAVNAMIRELAPLIENLLWPFAELVIFVLILIFLLRPMFEDFKKRFQKPEPKKEGKKKKN